MKATKKMALIAVVGLMFMLAGILTVVNKPYLHIYASEGQNILAYGDFTNKINSLSDAQDFFEFDAKELNINGEQLEIDKITPSINGYVYTFNQYYKGYEVYARSVKLNVDKSGKIISLTSNFFSNLDVDLSVEITQEQASDRAIEYLESMGLCCDQPQLHTIHALYYQGIMIYSLQDRAIASHVFKSENGIIFVGINGEFECNYVNTNRGGVPISTTQVDASGDSIDLTVDHNETSGLITLKDLYRNITVYDCGYRVSLVNKEITAVGGIFKPHEVSTLNNIVKTYDFFADADNIGVSVNGIDNSIKDFSYDDAWSKKEITVRMYINFNMDNAFYAGGSTTQNPYFVFGIDSRNSINYAIASDVVAHEYQHAVNEFNAGLVYSNASGALDEALADLFGALVEGYEMSDERFWIMGETLAQNGSTSFRSIINPEESGYRSRVTNQFPFCLNNNHNSHYNCDNGGVHLNSTIISHAFYQMYLNSVENGITAFTKQNIAKALYLTVQNLTSNSNWKQFRVIYEQSLAQIGLSEQELEEMLLCTDYGFTYVGIVDGKDAFNIRYSLTGDFTGTAPSTQTGISGTTFVIPSSNISAPNTIFVGWAENVYETDRGRIYFVGESYVVPEKNVTLYPIGVKIWNGVSPSIWQGEGSQTNPYLINNEQDFASLAYRINAHNLLENEQEVDGKYFRLTASVDFALKEWYPVGMNVNETKIYFDGGFNEVKNLKISAVGTYRGLFGYLNGSVKNLGIRSGEISSNSAHVGAVVARLEGVISSCYNYIASTSENGMAGGIVGKAVNSLIENCINYGAVNAKASLNSSLAGGIVANIDLATRVINCANYGRVFGSQPGGIVSKVAEDGGADLATGAGIYNCVNRGVVAFNSFAVNSGGVVASIFAVSGYKVFGNKSDVAVLKAGTSGSLVGFINMENAVILQDNHVKFGSTVGSFPSKAGVEINDELDLETKDFYLASDNWSSELGLTLFDFDMYFGFEEGVLSVKPYQYWYNNATSFTVGNGTESNPYQISSAGQLANLLNSTLQASYILTADIDLAGKVWTGGYLNGKFDGNGYVIKNLIASGIEYSALFVSVLDSVIDGVTLVDCVVKSANKSAGIAGLVYNSEIKNCVVDSGYIEGLRLASGICVELNGNIFACSNSATIYGLKASGIAGSVDDINTDEVDPDETGDQTDPVDGEQTESTIASVVIFKIQKSVNLGKIMGEHGAGILAVALGSVDIVDCINLGIIASKNSSGILALTSTSEGTINIIGCKHDGELLGDNKASVSGVSLEGTTFAVTLNVVKTHYTGNVAVSGITSAQLVTNNTHSVTSIDTSDDEFYLNADYFSVIDDIEGNLRLYLLVNFNYQNPTVVFLSENGEVLKIETVERMTNATPPQIEQRPNDEFNVHTLYWSGKYQNVNNNSIVKESYTTVRLFKVSYQTNGGELIADEYIELTSNHQPDDAVRAGYEFVGWFIDEDLTVEFDGDVSENTTLYAKWLSSGASCVCGTLTVDMSMFIGLFAVLLGGAMIILLRKKSKTSRVLTD